MVSCKLRGYSTRCERCAACSMRPPMRSFLLACLIVPALAGAAHAQIRAYTQEERLRVLDLPSVSVGSGRWGWSAFAQSTASADESRSGGTSTRTAGADLAAGGEIAYASDGCRFIVAGGQARLALADDGHVAPTAEQWVSFCLVSGPFLSFELGHHLEWDVRPAFDAPRTLYRRSFSRETFWFTYTFLDTTSLLEGGNHLIIISTTPRFGLTWQPDGAAASGNSPVLDVQVDVIGFRYLHQRPNTALGDVTFDFFDARVDVLDRMVDDSVMRFSLFRLGGVREGDSRWALDGDLGVSLGLLTDYDATSMVKIDLRSVGGFTASAGVRYAGDKLAGGVLWNRSVTPTIDERIAADDRLTQWIQDPAHGLTERAFVARTKTFGRDRTADQDDVTFGAGLDWAHDLPHGFRVGATAEVAHTYYAALDGGATPEPGFAMRVLAVLSARFSSR